MVIEIKGPVASERKVLTRQGVREVTVVMEMFRLDLGEDYRMYIFVKACWTVQLNWVFYYIEISWPLNRTSLYCVGPLIAEFFQ